MAPKVEARGTACADEMMSESRSGGGFFVPAGKVVSTDGSGPVGCQVPRRLKFISAISEGEGWFFKDDGDDGLLGTTEGSPHGVVPGMKPASAGNVGGSAGVAWSSVGYCSLGVHEGEGWGDAAGR